MKLKFEIIEATALGDGDIFYCTPNFDLNEFGPHAFITGTDQIFIRDDYNDEDEENNYSIIVNGGHIVWFTPGEKVVRLGHYSELTRVLEMVKMGNPQMEVGPNDSATIVQNFQEENPDLRIDLLDGLGGLEFSDDSEE